jgi:hypothetical protein
MELKLFMLLLGCKPKRRLTEQHDIFFGIGKNLADLVPAINEFWPEAEGKIHIDAWREVVSIAGKGIVAVITKKSVQENPNKLFFINLGGYRKDIFDEQHHKLLVIAQNKKEAIDKAKSTEFFLTNGFSGALSHIDDKYGLDVDDIHEIEDILPTDIKEKYALGIIPGIHTEPDEIHLGYLKLSKIK